MKAENSIVPITDPNILSSSQGPMIILWAIRKYGPLDFGQLFKIIYLGNETTPHSPKRSTVSEQVDMGSTVRLIVNALEQLFQAGLIDVDGDLSTLNPSSNRRFNPMQVMQSTLMFSVSPHLATIQELFGISLTDYAEGKGTDLRIEPSFSRPHEGSWSEIFVVMPFLETLKPIYENHVLPAVRGLDLTCKRGDDFFSDDSIIDEVWSAIYFSKLCIAECTGRNANVFYEIGIAHTLGRPCILIAQSVDDIPFDVQHRRVIIYENTPRGLRKFREQLVKAVQSELDLKTGSMTEIFDKLL